MSTGWTLTFNRGWLMLTGAAFLAVAGCVQHGTSRPAKPAETAIRQVLQAQVEAWNRGDIAAFMDGYIRSERLRFAGASGVKRGWDETLARYRTTYPNREAMGTLAFQDLEIATLSDRHAEVFGRYRLRRGGSYADATGFFTLLFEQTAAGWRIVHDHSSAAEQ